eukprot:comp22735_c0_seq1/m.35412 comp22735_c0_seq1/g.35412  ORF comp22735_c0_seq1/g.35412 comp22735_c0_seq1/m.35412 type:complete len:539 (-) comp22735_c0_seq1:83-1699(-)
MSANIYRDQDTSSVAEKKAEEGFVGSPGHGALGVNTENEGSSIDTDDAILEQMGYKQELNRGFNGFMSFAFCFTSVNVLSSLSATFDLGLYNGGPAAMVYTWFISGIMTLFTGLALAEICSKYPSAGSVYHWAGVLAGPKYCAIASYIDGWFNFLGNLAGCSAFAYGFASMLSSALVVGGGEGLSQKMTAGVAMIAQATFVVVNVLKIGQQGYMYIASVTFQLLSAFGIALAIIVAAPERASPEFVFTKTYDGTGFNSFGLAILLGVLVPTYSMSGYEAGAHLAEETKNASKSASMGIVYCCLCSSVFGFFYLFGLLFGIADFDKLLEDEQGLGATIQVYYDTLGKTGALIATWILVINLYFAGVSSMTVTSRIAFAMGRDGGLPFSSWVSKVSFNSIPINSILLVFYGGTILLILPMFNDTAFAAITSLTVIGYQISYALPIWCRLTISANRFTPTKIFSLGAFSKPIGLVAATWLTFSACLLVLPGEAPVTVENMNYTIVVTVGAVLIAGANWFISARHHFQGPIKALAEHKSLGH